MSKLIFHGGPLDGTSQPTQEGFPAPDGYSHRTLLNGEWYYRFHTDSEGSHHYRIRPIAPVGSEEGKT